MHACSGREYCISDVTALLERWGAADAETKEWVIGNAEEPKSSLMSTGTAGLSSWTISGMITGDG
ncbi:MAG TPA: hypothetical protein DIS74_10845 [Bacteroidales bacterium]|nr:hypothetical protein [Bacteroidales bacterium]